MGAPKNPPAFPQAPQKSLMERPPAPAPGMSLRDWFAGRAMGALLGDSRMMVMFDKISRGDPKGSVANVAYGLADAMLAEREKGGDA